MLSGVGVRGRDGSRIADIADDRRNRRLLARAEDVARKRLERYVGTRVRAFVEARSERHPHLVQGRTTHNLPVHFPGDDTLVGSTVEVEVVQATAYGLGALPS